MDVFNNSIVLICRCFAALLILLFVAFVVLTLYIASVHRRYAHLPGPSYTSFYLGHLPQLRAYRNRGEYVSRLFHQWAEEHGPCFKLFILYRCVVSMNGVPLIKEFLTKSRYEKSPSTYKKLANICGLRFIGHGLLNETDHAQWYQRRMIINPVFHKKYLRMSMAQFNEVGDSWISAMDGLADGKTMIKMHDYLCRITLDAISEVAFNFKMNAIESDSNPFIVSILYMLQAVSKTLRDPLFSYRPSEKKFRGHVRESIKFLRGDFGQRLLTERVTKIKNGEPVPQDILAYIIKCKELIPELTDEDLLDDILTLFIAGQETTSNVLSFLFLEAGQRPEVILKLQEEVDTVLEGRSVIDYEDLTKLEYVGQVIKETLRLYPPASGTSRLIKDEITIEGFRIPSQTNVLFSFYVIQRLSRYYKDPEDFRPERFAKTEPKQLFTYLPFSVGHRACIGQQFALIESKVLVCKFFQKFKFTLDPNQSFDILETATLRPKGGTQMIIEHR